MSWNPGCEPTGGNSQGNPSSMESELSMKTITFVAGIFLAMVSHAAAQPAITGQPQSRTNVVGTAATFSIIATGAPALTYLGEQRLESPTDHQPCGPTKHRSQCTGRCHPSGWPRRWQFYGIQRRSTGVLNLLTTTLNLPSSFTETKSAGYEPCRPHERADRAAGTADVVATGAECSRARPRWPGRTLLLSPQYRRWLERRSH